jgi:hypothetical protein
MVAMLTKGNLAQTQGPGGGVLFDAVSSARLELERLDDTRREALRQRAALNTQLGDIATQIQRRKASVNGKSLLPDFVLADLLSRSQALSESLALQNREIEALDQARRVRVERLISLYDQLVKQTTAAVRSADRVRQGQQLGVLAKARAEREALRAELALAPIKPLMISLEDLLASDDPHELRERADVVRDEYDRCLKQFIALDKRIAELEAEMRLNHELYDIVGDLLLEGVGEDKFNLTNESLSRQIQSLKQRRTQVEQEISRLEVLSDRIREKIKASVGN